MHNEWQYFILLLVSFRHTEANYYHLFVNFLSLKNQKMNVSLDAVCVCADEWERLITYFVQISGEYNETETYL